MFLNAILHMSGSFKSLTSSYVNILSLEKYHDEFDKFLNLPNNISSNKNKIRLNKDFKVLTIEFKNVCFRYEGQKNDTLKNINIKFDVNEKISIVDENGAGKSTFIKLLVRLYDPTKGAIYVNELNIRDIHYEGYTKLFSTVFQDYQLFAFTLKDNITMGMEEKSEANILEYIEKYGLSNKVNKLPKGIYTSIYKIFDEEGIEFSGGEAQKLALARALYKDSCIVILDEPTAVLDPKAEYRLYEEFNQFTNNKTALYISHRLSSTKFCDKVLVFDKGSIIEQGSHSELMSKRGVYHNLFSVQANQYIS